MKELKSLFQDKAIQVQKELKDILKNHGDLQVDTVVLRQVLGGMRGIKSMFSETSLLDPMDGIKFRGYSIPQLRDELPKPDQGEEPLPEGLFWLMLTGEVPEKSQVDALADEWEQRSRVPKHTYKMLDAMPRDTHPMTLFSMAISSMQTESHFAKSYQQGISKTDYWDPMYEDVMDLIAKLPHVAAYIYRRVYHNDDHIEADESLDWAANFAHMLGNSDPEFQDLMRLYLTIHADHEGGNASAHTTHLVGSTLSDAYYSLSAGMNALAGPLHGLANQEVIKFIFSMLEEIGTQTPTDEQVSDFIHKTLNEGRVIPGYGHAVLRQPDPRFTAQKNFAEKNLQDDDLIQVVWQLFRLVPDILGGLGKVKNPWPNVDAHSGAILVHYGIKEYTFYTVLFGVSRALGVLSNLCWSRALGLPLERPKSVNLTWIKNYIKQNND